MKVIGIAWPNFKVVHCDLRGGGVPALLYSRLGGAVQRSDEDERKVAARSTT